MAKNFTVTLHKLIVELGLQTLFLPETENEILISTLDVNRPELLLSGFYENFEPQRIQILGKMEFAYLQKLDNETKKERFEKLFKSQIPAIVITKELQPFDELLDAAKQYNIPVLKSNETTSSFMSSLISYLSVELAPRITRHGVLIEVYGEGVLLLGESGVGKSETAIELVKRGHRLVADDAVEIRKVSNRTLVGSSPENIRHFLELRGIGIINARRLFGIGSVKVTEKIDVIINLELWDANKNYDRMGIDNQYTNILGVDIPSLTIPVKPGRNLAVILEVAAMNNRQKTMGYNAAQELLENLGMAPKDKDNSINWDLY